MNMMKHIENYNKKIIHKFFRHYQLNQVTFQLLKIWIPLVQMNARRNIKLKMLNVYKEKPKFKLKTDIYLRNI